MEKKLRNDFNEIIEPGFFDSNVTSIIFGIHYNQPIRIDILPLGLTRLVFGKDYNQPIGTGVLPASLTSLVFGVHYNQPIGTGVLPASLTSLVFGFRYKQPIGVDVLPTSLTTIVFGYWYCLQRIKKNTIPEKCHIYIRINYNKQIPIEYKRITFYAFCNDRIKTPKYSIVLQNRTYTILEKTYGMVGKYHATLYPVEIRC
jgi:hypothetical protein